jgi:hypothetical protein
MQVRDRLKAVRCAIFLDRLDEVRVPSWECNMKDRKKSRSDGINTKVIGSVVDNRQANTYHCKEVGGRGCQGDRWSVAEMRGQQEEFSVVVVVVVRR